MNCFQMGSHMRGDPRKEAGNKGNRNVVEVLCAVEKQRGWEITIAVWGWQA